MTACGTQGLKHGVSAMASEAEYLIIGGGLSGAYTALQLRERSPDASIVILDAGESKSDWRADPNYARLLRGEPKPTSCGETWRAWPERENRFGGRSWCWHGALIEPTPEEFDENGRTWLLTMNGALEDPSWFDAARRWLGERSLLQDSAPASAVGFPPRFDELGFKTAARACRTKHGIREAFSPTEFLCDVRNPRTEIFDAAPVSAIASEGTSWRIEAQRHGAPLVWRARKLIIAAGAIKSGHLIAGLTRRVDDLMVHDHLVAGAGVRVVGAAREQMRACVGQTIYRREQFEGRAVTCFFSVMAPGDESVVFDAWCFAEQDRTGGSVIRLDGSFQVRPMLTSSDHRTQQGLIEKAAALVGEFAGVRPSRSTFVVTTGAAASRRFWQDQPFDTVQPYVSPLGTSDHEGAVVRQMLELSPGGVSKRWPTLAVVGPASFPSVFVSNPSLTTFSAIHRLCFGERF